MVFRVSVAATERCAFCSGTYEYPDSDLLALRREAADHGVVGGHLETSS